MKLQKSQGIARIAICFLLLSFILSSCSFKKSKKETANSNGASENDTVEIVRIPYKTNPKRTEYEISMLKGTKTYHGIRKRFYEHGSLYSETPYYSGKREGISYTYYPVYDGSQPQVWKEQPYVDGELTGICRRYHRNGKLQSEYEYKSNMAAMGIRMWNESGRELVPPEIILDKKEKAGLIMITVRMSNKAKNLRVFYGNLVDGKYFSKYYMTQVEVINGVGTIVLTKSEDRKSLTVVAENTTPYRNAYFLSKDIEL